MRVIAGENKGRTLKTVSSRATRPTTDKVKETIFNMIGPFFTGGQVLDLYAGSGGLGLEALSRGADQAVFVDRSGSACRIIKENIASCRYEERAEVIRFDAKHALDRFSGEKRQFDYVFLDPPYAKQRLVEEINFMQERQLLSQQALVTCEHDRSIRLPEQFPNGLLRWKYRTYQGQTAVSIYRFEDETQEGESL